jgi:hypothetical protein
MNRHFTAIIFCMLSALQLYSQNTLFIQTDKAIYFPGETIWFKACSRGTASNFYAGLYDAAGKQLSQKKYPLLLGSANGDFTLPDSLNTACVVLYAQLADGAVCRQRLLIAGSQQPLPLATAAAKLSLYAEGGQLVAGVSNYMAIQTNLPYPVSGSIKAEGAEPVNFITASGLAYVQLMPQVGLSYYAQWQDAADQWVQTPLPAVQPAGIALHSEQTSHELHYRIQSVGSSHTKGYLTMQQGSNIIYKSELLLADKADIVGHITTDSLQNGMLYLTVSNEAGDRLAQKVAIIQHGNAPVFSVAQYTGNWQPKGKQMVVVTLPDAGNYAASITAVDFAVQQNIVAQWHPQQADVAAICQQWPPPAGADEGQYLAIGFAGKSRGFGSKEALNIIVKDRAGTKQFGNIPAQDTRFYQPGYIFYDTARVYYQLAKDKDRVDELAIETNGASPLPAQIAPVVLEALPQLPGQKQLPGMVMNDSAIKNFGSAPRSTFNAAQTLQEVKVKAKRWGSPEIKRMQELEDTYASGPFKGMARGFILSVMDDPNAEAVVDIYNYIAFRVPGLGIKYDRTNGKILAGMRGRPVIFINEQESPNEMLQTISISQVAYVKYIPGIVVGLATNSTSGVLYVYTKKGNEQLPASNNILMAKLKGYDMPQNFTLPDYDNAANRLVSDQRSSLYWNPYLQPDEEGSSQCTIQFFNNDFTKKLLLTIQGVDGEGRPVYWQKILEQDGR